MKKKQIIALALAMLMLSHDTFAFCGFYVAKAPTDLFNEKSEVIYVRDGNRNVITMSNDFNGDVKDFAMVVPVPVVLREDQIREVNRGIFDRLDAYSAPRLVEYFDENPCQVYKYEIAETSMARRAPNMQMEADMQDDAVVNEYKVTIEAEYTIGSYDVLLLSAKESSGLQMWLVDNGYKVPESANEVLEPYIKNDTKFFVVKVNLERQAKSGYEYLNPLQIEFESDRFMLPIRLGMANSKGSQDLIIYAFTKSGRVETVNYRTVKIPTDRNVPLFVESYFGDFYTDLFDRSYYRESMKSVFLEYAWNVSPNNGVKCDPCVSPPPVFNDFTEAGVNWVTGLNQQSQVFFTRLHVRYSRAKFPQDLQFQITPNRENFQARYILNHPATGDLTCDAGENYLENLESRRKVEVDELAALAGWTNPNYRDYITEYSKYKKDGKYAPKRNFTPPFLPINSTPQPPSGGKWLMVIAGLLGIAILWRLRQKQFRLTENLN